MNYNFAEAQRKWPKAVEHLFKWIHANYHSHAKDEIELEIEKILICSTHYTREFNPRDLDQYFDEQKIAGSIEIDGMSLSKEGNSIDWIYYKPWIFYNGIGEMGALEVRNTRSEALVALWDAEFAILEERLTNV